MHYGPGSPRQRHDDRGDPSSDGSKVISVAPPAADMSACTADQLPARPLFKRTTSCVGSNPAIVSWPKLQSLKSKISGPLSATRLALPSGTMMSLDMSLDPASPLAGGPVGRLAPAAPLWLLVWTVAAGLLCAAADPLDEDPPAGGR